MKPLELLEEIVSEKRYDYMYVIIGELFLIVLVSVYLKIRKLSIKCKSSKTVVEIKMIFLHNHFREDNENLRRDKLYVITLK
jgi:hypothetical protein